MSLLKKYLNRIQIESEYFVGQNGKARDDEGNEWETNARPGIRGLRNFPKPISKPKSAAALAYETRQDKIAKALKNIPETFTKSDIAKAANSFDDEQLNFKQKFGILINQAQKNGKKLS
jgi:hypothetical protein